MAEKDFSYKVDKLDHANPKLVRYMYKHSLGTTRAEGIIEENQAQSYSNVQGNKHYSQLAGSSSSASKEVAIKFENDDLRALSESKAILESAKVALGKLLLQSQDLLPYVANKEFQKSFQLIADTLQQFLTELRVFLASIVTMPDPADASKYSKVAADLKAKAFVHQDGIKAKIKHAKTLAATTV
jgi:hypothetical protein